MSNVYQPLLPGRSSKPKKSIFINAICVLLLVTAAICICLKIASPSITLPKVRSLSPLKLRQSDSEYEDSPIVRLPWGRLKGQKLVHNGKAVYTFLGIPFAVPPIGPLRFKKPIPWTKSWHPDVRDATQMGQSCLQIKEKYQPSSEDCLYLNVWTTVNPLNASNHNKRPVFVNIFGGTFRTGSTTDYRTNGLRLTAFTDAVFVSMNFRVGPLGYMYGGQGEEMPANVAHFDQLLAMEWVQKQIHLFGGNPDNVTLCGDSSGSVALSLHILSPLSQPYFNQGIMMSGVTIGITHIMSPGKALIQANALSKSVGCGFNPSNGPLSLESIECLRQVDGHLLLQEDNPVVASVNPKPGFISFLPVYGDDHIPEHPLKLLLDGKHKKGGSFIIGTVLNEGTAIDGDRPDVTQTQTPKETFGQSLVTFLKTMNGKIPATANEAREVYYTGVKEGNSLEAVRAYNDVLGDIYFNCPSKIFAEALSRDNLVYQYVFTHPTGIHLNSTFPPQHAQDIVIFFGTDLVTEADYIVSNKIQKEIRQFMWTGKTSWSPYFRTKSGYLVNSYQEFNARQTDPLNLNEYRSLTCNFWKKRIWSETLSLANCS